MGVMNAYYYYKPPKVSVVSRGENENVYTLRDMYEKLDPEDVSMEEYSGPRESDELWHVKEVEFTSPMSEEEVLANFNECWGLGDRETESDYTRLVILENKVDALLELILGGELE